jgi:hypothetical protein
MVDEYEREYMAGKGEVLYRKKVRGPRWLVGLLGGIPLVVGGALSAAFFSAGNPLVALGAVVGALTLSAVLATIMIVFAAARIVVSEGELYIQIGPAGPRLAIDEIESFGVADSGYRGRGVGVRKNPDGKTIYSMYGDGKHAVRLKITGQKRPIFLVCPDPDELCEALARAKDARGRKADTAPKVIVGAADRVDESEPEEVSSNEAAADDAAPDDAAPDDAAEFTR